MSLTTRALETLRPISGHARSAKASRPIEVMLPRQPARQQ